MKVTPFDHVLRFHVTSESQGETEHVVDLSAFSGHGRCSCQHFEFRILPDLTEGRPAARCKHIAAARDRLADEVIARVMEQEGPNPHE